MTQGPRIAVLPPALANQIAAGEVVERPASVVKELVENALDAGATTIFVDVEEGGRRLIRVVDDGHGMSREDAVLAVERHATSKIHTVEDLQAIGTLGFRGEALPSIASVSRFCLATRTAEDGVGTELRVDGGSAPAVRDIGGPVGTRIEVADLFHVVPARLKFLKRTATEMGHIHALIADTALGNPHVHLRLGHNGRVGVDHPSAPSLKHRIFQVLGRQTTEHLYEVRLDGPVRVLGFISDPTFQSPTARGVHTFVNGRPIRDRVVQHAVVSAYGNLLERGRHPHAVLYLWVPPDELDVNVHPAKAEVRFVRPGEVHEAIVRACRETLRATPWVSANPNPLYAPPRPLAPMPLGETRATPLPMDAWGLARDPAASAPRPPGDPASPEPAPQPSELDFRPGQRAAVFSRLRVIGQADRTWLICEDREGLVIIDQHAAHERVGYERIKAGYCTARLARQQLLFPLQIELSASEATSLTDHRDALDRLGFAMEPFGGNTWQVTAVPALLAKSDVEGLVRDLITELCDIGRSSLGEAQLDLLFATMACHTVVRAGDRLNNEEIRALLEAMDDVDLGANCPHGRPVLVNVPFADLERRMHRR
ncbi:MAG: DNA mismatch repair endonuclease MutL [Deltaproteobacteria bacterium]|nr:DNA mismatch repair endonuclease MutL [Deltaproteobacteria bacterium]MCB9788206.1 DNA mismatch repair endonuclease MutL [Deltaproteobacteria bacterium]